MHGSRGCFGCCKKPTLITAGDDPSKGSIIEGETVQNPGISDSEDYWSSCTSDMDDSVLQSKRRSSFQKKKEINISNQPLDHISGTSSMNDPSEFVNHGLLLWNQTRQQWLANKKPQNRQQIREHNISWNTGYESLLGTNKPFPQPIPLVEMVDFLVDVWEQEGLYD